MMSGILMEPPLLRQLHQRFGLIDTELLAHEYYFTQARR